MVAFVFWLLVALWLLLLVRSRLSVRVAGGRVVVSWFVPRRFVGGRFCSVSWRVGRWSWRLWLRWSLPGGVRVRWARRRWLRRRWVRV